jgi:hypothetical protein
MDAVLNKALLRAPWTGSGLSRHSPMAFKCALAGGGGRVPQPYRVVIAGGRKKPSLIGMDSKLSDSILLPEREVR